MELTSPSEKKISFAEEKCSPLNSVNTYNCSSFARFPSSEGREPLKLFELMLLKIHQKFHVRHAELATSIYILRSMKAISIVTLQTEFNIKSSIQEYHNKWRCHLTILESFTVYWLLEVVGIYDILSIQWFSASWYFI